MERASLSAWDEITQGPQFYDHIIRLQTSNWSLLVTMIVNRQLSQFYFIKTIYWSHHWEFLVGEQAETASFIFLYKTRQWFSRGI